MRRPLTFADRVDIAVGLAFGLSSTDTEKIGRDRVAGPQDRHRSCSTSTSEPVPFTHATPDRGPLASRGNSSDGGSSQPAVS